MTPLKVGEYYTFNLRVRDEENASHQRGDLLKILSIKVSMKEYKFSPVKVPQYRVCLHNLTNERKLTITVGEDYSALMHHNYPESLRRKLVALGGTI